MSEIQKIAIGLLGMSHPEIHRYRTSDFEAATRAEEPCALHPAQTPTPGKAASALRELKFAIAALFAGARAIPLGDNGPVVRQLGEYGAHLRGC